MANGEKGIAFSVPSDLHQRFKAAADAEHRSIKGALITLMEEKAAEHEANDRRPVAVGEAA